LTESLIRFLLSQNFDVGVSSIEFDQEDYIGNFHNVKVEDIVILSFIKKKVRVFYNNSRIPLVKEKINNKKIKK
jgi:hypothetical protein